MPDDQKDESLGVEQLPQAELEASPDGEKEQPFDPEAAQSIDQKMAIQEPEDEPNAEQQPLEP